MSKLLRPALVSLLILLFSTVTAQTAMAQTGNGQADEGGIDIDSLFDEPDGETDGGHAVAGDTNEDSEAGETSEIGDTDETGPVVDIGALTTSAASVTGSVSAGLGFGLGLIEWPGSAAADGRDLSELRRYSALYSTSARMTVDARPASYLRFRTSLSSSLNVDRMAFNSPGVDELFVDYTFADTVFVRAGYYGMTWGQGRLLDNPANLVTDVSDGVAVRGTVPLGPGTVTALVYSKKAWVDAYTAEHPAAFAYAGQWEATLGPVTMGLAGRYRKDDLVGSTASMSYGVGNLTFAADGVRWWDKDDPTGGMSYWQAMGHAFWESDDRAWSLMVEYEFDQRVRNDRGAYIGHRTGVAMRAPKVGGSTWRPAVRWEHAFQDDSGKVIPGISGTVAPSLSMSIGVPVVYGAPGTFYRDALIVESGEAAEDREPGAIPIDNVVSVLVAVSLSFSF